MNDEFLDRSKEHYTRTWVALLTSVVGAVGLIIAAIIGVDAKHDREAAAATITARDAQVKELQQRLNAVPAGAGDSADLLNQIASLRSALAAKDAEIQRLQSLTLTTPSAVPVEGPPPQQTLAAQEEAGIRFELQGCRLSGSEITCNFLVTNSGDDRNVTLCSPCWANRSRAVDMNGNEYLGQAATLGQDRGPEPRATLASGIPLRASITFGRVKPTSGLKLLEVSFRARGDYQVKFHDIPLS